MAWFLQVGSSSAILDSTLIFGRRKDGDDEWPGFWLDGCPVR